MNPWSAFVDALASVLVSVADLLGGGLGVGIVVTTFVLRSLLIPILRPLAAKTRARLRVVRRIRPQIKALDQQFKDDPSTLQKRLNELHAANGIKMVDWPGLVGALIQVPILIAMFQAVLEVWEADALNVLALGLGLVAAALSVAGTKMSGQAEGAKWMLWMSGVLPVAICLWLGPGVGYYLCGFYAAAMLQAALMGQNDPVDGEPAESA